jgi:Kef-type K+ transport system membrane component KefB
MNTDLSVFTRVQGTILLTIVIVVSSVFSKFFSGWIAAKMRGYTNGESSLIAATSIPQLSTTLAVVYTGLTAGYIEQNLATAMITLSIVTTFIAPILNNTFIKRSPSIQRRIRAAAHGQE